MNLPFAYSIDDVTLLPKYSNVQHRKNVDLSVDLGKGVKIKFPIIPANMRDITGPRMATTIAKMGGLAILHRFQTAPYSIIQDYYNATDGLLKEDRNLIGCSIGIQEKDFELAKRLVGNYKCKIICVDVAHAHNFYCLEFISHLSFWLKKYYPEVLLIAGNVATFDGAEALYNAGADVIKVGISSGSICETRIKSGNGCSTFYSCQQIFSTEQEASEILGTSGRRYKIIADGGAKSSGDIGKLLCCSDAVMVDYLLEQMRPMVKNYLKLQWIKIFHHQMEIWIIIQDFIEIYPLHLQLKNIKIITAQAQCVLEIIFI